MRKEYLFIGLLLLISIASLLDVISDYLENESWLHLLTESVLILLSLTGIIYLVLEIFRYRHHNERLEGQLENTENDLNNTRSQLKKVRQEYQLVIQEQLDLWQLSDSEREVAMLLLKGLSFKEIAEIRETQEKTVRQQASSLYKKADLAGRHEFSAYFFEDLL